MMNNFESPKRASNPEKGSLHKLNSWGKRITLGVGLLFGSLGIAKAEIQKDTLEKGAITNIDTASEKEIQDARAFYESEREWLIGVIQSPAYKARLMKEGYEDAVADEMVRMRLKNVMETPIHVASDRLPHIDTTETGKVLGRYTPPTALEQGKVEFPPIGYKAPSHFGLTIHEEAHASTEGDVLMSEHAKKLYKDNYYPIYVPLVDESGNEIYNSEPADQYYSEPAELDARKKVLEYEMEILGIKKYGEEFTREHLDWLNQHYNTLSPNSKEFLDRIKNANLIQIMNEIAQDDVDDVLRG